MLRSCRKWKYPHWMITLLLFIEWLLCCFSSRYYRKVGRSRERELVNLYSQILIEDFTITSSSHVHNLKCCPAQTPPGVISPLVCLIGKLTFFLFLSFSLSQSDKENNASDWQNQLNNPPLSLNTLCSLHSLDFRVFRFCYQNFYNQRLFGPQLFLCQHTVWFWILRFYFCRVTASKWWNCRFYQPFNESLICGF